MKITDWMEKNVSTCRLEDSLEEAAGTMLKEDVGALPVVDSAHKLVGMITDRDICMSSLIEGRSLKELPVSLAASTDARACAAEDSLVDACTAMQTHKVHRIPVVNKERKVVGIIGLADVVRATDDKKSGATQKGLIETLGAILEPRKHATPLAAPSTLKASAPPKTSPLLKGRARS